MKVKNADIVKYLGDIDLLLLSSGFEDRSKTLGDFISKSKTKDTFIFHLKENYTLAENNFKHLSTKFDDAKKIEYPKNDSFNSFYLFYETFLLYIDKRKEKREKIKVVVDATGFSREILLILIKVLTRPLFLKYLNIIFIHTPVENYSNEDGFWLTKGVREIRPIFGYSGTMTPSKKLLLIVFNGFEEERTEIIIQTFEPHSLILAKPSKTGSINHKLKEIADLKYEKIKTKFNNILLEEKEFSCIEIESTISLLNEIYLKYHENFNIAISPLNNKTSTIAIALASIRNESFQVCYASANQYNINKKLKPSEYFLTYNLSSFLE